MNPKIQMNGRASIQGSGGLSPTGSFLRIIYDGVVTKKQKKLKIYKYLSAMCLCIYIIIESTNIAKGRYTKNTISLLSIIRFLLSLHDFLFITQML